ncbi:hypothetical protein [Alloactinosynnema sp. L-07]|uniref:NAD(P)-dependent oxidoreductase n=1 Tax=Alloactinosynnema sp. L-07 TaxID=1653480 RepID=UPI00065F0B14|nr:NAD(P)H-binding protein [Alloactinosynnema sp. L-07]CRK62010.1 hypothetical protein [Alloactinosynnema sp. L-07]
MKLAIFGAAGLAGAAVAQLALDRGDQVRALVRSTKPPGVLDRAEIVRGDALDPAAVAATVAGSDVVISTLGGYRGPDSIDKGTMNIIGAMRRTGPRRLVVLQGFHIGFPGDPNNPGKHLVEAFLAVRCRPLLGRGAALGELLRGTGDLDWTLVRIPRMVDGPPSGRAAAGTFRLGPISSVRVGDVADHLYRLAQERASIHEAPMLHTPRTAQKSHADPDLTRR